MYSVFQTDSGTALHEAAVYGKQDVVCLLLKQGNFTSFSICFTKAQNNNDMIVSWAIQIPVTYQNDQNSTILDWD